LTAGALAAKRGKRVLVLERHSVVGGYAQNFRRGEFHFDAALHAIGGIHSTGFAGIIRELGLMDRIGFLKQPRLFRSVFPDFEMVIPSGNPEETARILSERFPAERFRIRMFFALLRQVLREDRNFFGPFRWLAMAFGPVSMPVTIVSEFLTADRILRWFFRDRQLRAVFGQLWAFFGLPPSRLQSQYFLPPMAGYLADGGYSIRGGSQRLSDALVDIILESGGEVRTRTEVLGIIVTGGRATGVKTGADETFSARNIVSNLSPHATYGKLLPDWEGTKKALAGIEKLELSMSGTQAYLGLDAPIAELWPELADDHEIFWNSTDDFDEMAREAASEKPFSDHLPSLGITLFTNTDPSMCPANRGEVGLFCADNLARWEHLSDEAYRLEKAKLERSMIETAERVLPGLSKHVIRSETGTPRTMKRYTGNPAGALYGFAQTVSQGGYFKRFGNRSPLPGLLFASAWTFPGGGFEGVARAGAEAARKI
jgi:prolycopene isomerase